MEVERKISTLRPAQLPGLGGDMRGYQLIDLWNGGPFWNDFAFPGDHTIDVGQYPMFAAGSGHLAVGGQVLPQFFDEFVELIVRCEILPFVRI